MRFYYHLHRIECIQRLRLGAILDDVLVCLRYQRDFFEGYGGVPSVDGVEDALVAHFHLEDKADLAVDERVPPLMVPPLLWLLPVRQM